MSVSVYSPDSLRYPFEVLDGAPEREVDSLVQRFSKETVQGPMPTLEAQVFADAIARLTVLDSSVSVTRGERYRPFDPVTLKPRRYDLVPLFISTHVSELEFDTMLGGAYHALTTNRGSEI